MKPLAFGQNGLAERFLALAEPAFAPKHALAVLDFASGQFRSGSPGCWLPQEYAPDCVVLHNDCVKAAILFSDGHAWERTVMRYSCRSFSWLSACLLGVAVSTAAWAQDPVASDDIGLFNPEAAAHAFPKRGFSPYANRNYPTRVYWGDQHVHTGWSADAGAFGATLGPEEALRFARGSRSPPRWANLSSSAARSTGLR